IVVVRLRIADYTQSVIVSLETIAGRISIADPCRCIAFPSSFADSEGLACTVDHVLQSSSTVHAKDSASYSAAGAGCVVPGLAIASTLASDVVGRRHPIGPVPSAAVGVEVAIVG